MTPTPARMPALSGSVSRVLSLTVLLALVAGCAAFYQNPEVRILDVRVVGLGLTSGTAEVVLEVDNPNRFGLEVRGMDYLLEIAGSGESERWDTLAVGFHPDTIRLPRRSEERVVIQIPFRYQALGTAAQAWLQGGDIPYRLQGDLRARGPGGERDLSFRSRGSIQP